jgi:hypothetical protein
MSTSLSTVVVQMLAVKDEVLFHSPIIETESHPLPVRTPRHASPFYWPLEGIRFLGSGPVAVGDPYLPRGCLVVKRLEEGDLLAIG